MKKIKTANHALVSYLSWNAPSVCTSSTLPHMKLLSLQHNHFLHKQADCIKFDQAIGQTYTLRAEYLQDAEMRYIWVGCKKEIQNIYSDDYLLDEMLRFPNQALISKGIVHKMKEDEISKTCTPMTKKVDESITN